MNVADLDTSALVRLYVPDGPLPDGLEQHVDAAWRGDAVLLCPELVLAELAQVLLKKERAGFLDAATATEILDRVLELPIDFRQHSMHISRALELARLTDTSACDALFLAVAERHGAALVTADAELRRAWAAVERLTHAGS